MNREQKVDAGRLMDVDFYPVFDSGRKMPERAPGTKPSSAEKAKYNAEQAMKKFIRLVNMNFDCTDTVWEPTYRTEEAPQDERTAYKDMANTMRRIIRKRKKLYQKVSEQLADVRRAMQGMDDPGKLRQIERELKKRRKKLRQDLRYIYVIEKVTYKTGKLAGKVNYHFHAFLTGGMTAEELEKIWGKGGCRCEAFKPKPEQFGPEAKVVYLCKDPQGRKRYVCSRNLKQPKKRKPIDGQISDHGMARIACERVDDRDYWERRYRGYTFIRCYARFNPYNGHWYVSVRMYKKSKGETYNDSN